MKHALSIHRQKDAIDTWGTPEEIFNFAQNSPGTYGIVCILFAVFSGLIAATIFRRL